MKIYVAHFLQILNFCSPFRRFEIKNFLRRATMAADNISNLVVPPRILFISTGLRIHLKICSLNKTFNKTYEGKKKESYY